MTRNAHGYHERDRAEYLTMQASVAGSVREYLELQSLLLAAQRSAMEAEATRDQLPTEPATDELSRRGPAEVADPESVVADRRRREHARVLLAANGTVEAARATYRALASRSSDAEAVLAAARDVAQTRSERLLHLYERRASVYRRAYLRARAHRRLDQERSTPTDLTLPVTIAKPVWFDQRAPWRNAMPQQPIPDRGER